MTSSPVRSRPHTKVSTLGWRRWLSFDTAEDVFFLLTTVFAFAFAYLVARQGGGLVGHVAAAVVLWVILAYGAIPRLNQILTSIYVPDYFMGRTRASDGVLGDPVNVALVGSSEQVQTALLRAGWTRADPVTLRSSWGIIVSALAHRSYPAAPVSPLFLFGHMQNFAYQQEVDGNASQRHHVRFFRCPPGWSLPGGSRVDWLASASYDRRVGLSLFTGQVTHKIDADIDVERDHVVHTVLQANPQATSKVLRDFSAGYHSRNGGGDVIHTDGHLPILRLEDVPALSLPDHHVDHATTNVTGRPPSVLWAVVLALVSAFVSTTRSVVDLLNTDNPTTQIGLPASELSAARAVSIAVIVLIALGLLLLAFKTYQGRQWARIGTLLLAALSMVGHFGAGHTHLLVLLDTAVSLGIMYALTTSSARAWTGDPSSPSETPS